MICSLGLGMEIYSYTKPEGGQYFAPSPFEAAFVSLAHGREVVEETLAAAWEVFNSL